MNLDLRFIGRKAAVVGIFVAALVWVIPASAQDVTMPGSLNTLTVSGTGTASAAPDVAYIELGVQTVDLDLATAFSQTGSTIGAVLNALHELGIADEDIQTSGINVNPQDQYDPQSGSPTGKRSYIVTNTVQVTVRDVSQVEAVLTAAVGAGANTIYNLNFGIQDTSDLEAQARAQAVANAQDRAQQLASALNVTLGAPVIISEQPELSPPIPIFGTRATSMADASQPVSQGQFSVTVQVSVTFSIS